MNTRTFLALVGSPRPNSTSESLAGYFIDELAARGWETAQLSLPAAIRKPERWPELEERYRATDVIGLFFPLYVDSLPTEMTLALEHLVAVSREARTQRIFGVCQCGFLEAEQNDTALAICQEFARDAGLDWQGGFAIGAGGALGGNQWQKMGKMTAHITEAFAMTIEALDAGQPIPPTALAMVRKRFCPPWMYALMANISMLSAARKHGNLFRINARPYAR